MAGRIEATRQPHTRPKSIFDSSEMLRKIVSNKSSWTDHSQCTRQGTVWGSLAKCEEVLKAQRSKRAHLQRYKRQTKEENVLAWRVTEKFHA